MAGTRTYAFCPICGSEWSSRKADLGAQRSTVRSRFLQHLQTSAHQDRLADQERMAALYRQFPSLSFGEQDWVQVLDDRPDIVDALARNIRAVDSDRHCTRPSHERRSL